jgi:hypothetical protein
MGGAIPPLTQYAFMAWCLVKAQGQLYLYLTFTCISLNTQNTKRTFQIKVTGLREGYVI